MSEWQPIETAPKDGTVVDLWGVRYELVSPRRPDTRKTGQRFISARWVKPPHHGLGIADAGLGQERYQGEWVCDRLSKDWEITHWQPLPEPPGA